MKNEYKQSLWVNFTKHVNLLFKNELYYIQSVDDFTIE